MTPVFMLVYSSRSVAPVTPSLMDNLLSVARTKNSKDEITGLLVVRNDYFLQLLEGPQAPVEACYKRITRDLRHTDIILHGTAVTAARTMGQWNMGTVDSAGPSEFTAEMIALFEAGKRGQAYSHPESLAKIVSIFARGVRIIG